MLYMLYYTLCLAFCAFNSPGLAWLRVMLRSSCQALHMAAAMGHTDICALLLIHGPAAANKA